MHDHEPRPIQWLDRGAGVSRRTFLAAAAATPAALFLEACSRRTGPIGGRSPATPTMEDDPLLRAQLSAARSLPPEIRLRLWRGWRHDRGGEVITVPRGFNFFDGGITHSTARS